MPKRLDRVYECNTCGTPTRKLINRGTEARCAGCGVAAAAEANRRMSEAFAALKVQSGQSGQPSTVDTVLPTFDMEEAAHMPTMDSE